jgi:hypothetical protein
VEVAWVVVAVDAAGAGVLVVVEEEIAVESDGGLNGVDVAGVSIGKSRRLVANHWGECTRSSDRGSTGARVVVRR